MNMQVTRFRPAGIRPLELWSLPFEGGALWQAIGAAKLDARRTAGEHDVSIAAEFAQVLRKAMTVIEAHAGHADRVVFAGGITGLAGFAQEVGKAAVLPGAGFGPGAAAEDEEVVVDVGQTAIKVTRRTPTSSLVTALARDITRLPIITDESKLTRTEARELGDQAIAFAANALARGFETRAPSIVLGLPVTLDDDLSPGGCTYAGWRGRKDLVSAIATRASEIAGTTPARLRVMNDAELAALAARKAGLCGPGRTLVVTLGFGPGGAMVEQA